MENDFDPDKLTTGQINKLKAVLPCSRDGVKIADHDKRIKLLEDLNAKLTVLILGNEGQPSIFDRLINIDTRLGAVEKFLSLHANDLDDLNDTVSQSKLQKIFNSGAWKVGLVILGAIAGFIAKWVWVTFLL
jgi:hypothetical protein